MAAHLPPAHSHIKKPSINTAIFSEKSSVWILVCIVLIFIGLKIQHIQLPFFWDETGVYGNMIFHLADHELSLHPKAINEWISRGHPLLYPNMIAAVCKMFGTTVTVAHSANFFLACLLLISVYYTLGQVINSWVGMISAALLTFQPLFFAQSVFVLPEIALALFLWWTTWFFYKRNYLLYFILGSAAVMVKEPAIIWVGSLFLWELIFSDKKFSATALLWLTPLLTFGLFLIIQKITFGWYFFPYHTGGFDYNLIHVYEKLADYGIYFLRKEGRLIWLLVLILSLIMFIQYKRGKWTITAPNLPVRFMSGLFACLAYVLFSSTTFYSERYLMPIFPFLTSVVAYYSFYIIFRKKYAPTFIFILLCIVVPFFYHTSENFQGDLNMTYIRSIESSKKTIRYMLDRNMMEQGEFSATMPILYVTEDPRFGYMPEGVKGRKSEIVDDDTKYVVQITPGTQIENPDNYPLSEIEQWHDQDIKTIIYRVTPMDTIITDK